MTRADLAVICAELGRALSRIGERLGAPEPAAAPAAAPKAPVPATPQRQEAAAGPKPTQPERLMAFARERPHFTSREASEATGIDAEVCRVTLSKLVRDGRLEGSRSRPKRFRLPGAREPEQVAAPAAAAPSEPQEPDAEPAASAPAETPPVALSAVAKPAQGPTLRDRLLELAAGGPFTIGRAVSHTGKSTQQCYNLLGQLHTEGALVRSDYAPRTYALPGQLPPSPPANAAPPKPRAVPAMRNCLRCEKRFYSEGAHNRLCGNCSSTVSGMAIQ